MGLSLKNLDFIEKTLSVRDAKDRSTILPSQLIEPLQKHLIKVAQLHQADLSRGAGYAAMPGALYKKYPAASKLLAWQYVFPSTVLLPWRGR